MTTTFWALELRMRSHATDHGEIVKVSRDVEQADRGLVSQIIGKP